MSRRRVLKLLVLSAFLSGFLPATAMSVRPCCFQVKSTKSGPISILFVGNSLTYYNNTPEMVRQLAGAYGIDVNVDMVVEGGASLKDHWEAGHAQQAIRRGTWDFVVLQEQSTLGTTFMVEGVSVSANPDYLDGYAPGFVELIRRSGAEPVLFLHWAQQNLDSSEQTRLNYYLARVSSKLDVAIAPVGPLWSRVRNDFPDLDLFVEDQLHPTAAGSYLSALTLLTTLTRQDPDGVPARIDGAEIDEDTGAPTGRTVSLVQLSPERAGTLQRAVWENHSFLTSSDLIFEDPGAPQLPKPPPGRRPSPDELAGSWGGTIAIYPRGVGWPGRLELTIEARGKELSAPGGSVMRFTEATLEHPLEQFRITPEGVVFVDPDGPNGGIIRYTMSYVADGELAGIAEFIVDGEPIYGIGRVQLERGSRQ